MITKNFNRSEFRCKCGCGMDNVSIPFVERLQVARDIYGNPYYLTSGCRCEKHNRNVGGVADSDHIATDEKPCQAADIAFRNGKELFGIITALIQAGFTRIGINFNKNFVHVDSNPTKYQPTVFKY